MTPTLTNPAAGPNSYVGVRFRKRDYSSQPADVPYGAQSDPWISPRRPLRNGRTPAGNRPGNYNRPG